MIDEKLMEQFDKNQEIVKVINSTFEQKGLETDWDKIRTMFKSVLEFTTASVHVTTLPRFIINEEKVIQIVTRKLKSLDMKEVIKEIVTEFDKHKDVYFYQFFTMGLTLPLDASKQNCGVSYLIRYGVE